MNKNTNNLVKNYKDILLWSVAAAVLSFTITAFIPPYYKAQSSIAIVQKETDNLDAYREAKSSEFSASIIKEIISSNAFMEKVFTDNPALAAPFFKNEIDPYEKLKIWKKEVKISQVPNTGLLNITVYAKNKFQAKEIALAIFESLSTNSKEITSKQDLLIKQVNSPYFIDRAIPNVWLNTALGFVLGFILISALTYITEGKIIQYLSLFENKTRQIWSEKITRPNENSNSENQNKETDTDQPASPFNFTAADLNGKEILRERFQKLVEKL